MVVGRKATTHARRGRLFESVRALARQNRQAPTISSDRARSPHSFWQPVIPRLPLLSGLDAQPRSSLALGTRSECSNHFRYPPGATRTTTMITTRGWYPSPSALRVPRRGEARVWQGNGGGFADGALPRSRCLLVEPRGRCRRRTPWWHSPLLPVPPRPRQAPSRGGSQRPIWLSQTSDRRLGHEWATNSCL